MGWQEAGVWRMIKEKIRSKFDEIIRQYNILIDNGDLELRK